MSVLKKTRLLSVLTSLNSSLASSSSAGAESMHHTFLVLQKNMVYIKEKLFTVLLDVINCFRDIFKFFLINYILEQSKFFLIKGNKVPKRSVVSQHSRLIVQDILAGASVSGREQQKDASSSGINSRHDTFCHTQTNMVWFE